MQVLKTRRYEALVNDLKGLIDELRWHSSEILRLKHEIGSRLLKEKPPEGVDKWVGKLAEDLHYRKSEFYYCMQFSEAFPDFEEFMRKHSNTVGVELSWHYVTQVILPSLAREEAEEAYEGKALPPSVRILLGDFREVLKELSDVDLVVTDPPYAAFELWRDLAPFCKRVLQKGGFLIAYTPHEYLIELGRYLERKLDYYWVAGIYHTGGRARIWSKKINVAWKPILVFSNDKPGEHRPFWDMYRGEKGEKDLHEWAQGEKEAAYFVETFSSKGDLVCDPMCGSGTVLKAAYLLSRQAVGAEIDEENYKVAVGSFPKEILQA